MSRNIAARAEKKLQTRAVTVDVVGGSEDYCEEIIEFRNEDGGLVSTYNTDQDPVGKCTIWSEDVDYIPKIHTAAIIDYGGMVCFVDEDGSYLGETYVSSNCVPIIYYRMIDGRYRCVFMFGSDVTYLPGQEKWKFSYVPLCGVMHADRLFMVEKNDEYRIRWSSVGFDETDESCWDESIDGAGSLRLDYEGGPVLRMHSLGRDIVLVREYGVTVLHAIGEPRLFTLDKTQLFHGIIGSYGSTVCNGKVYFCTERILYSFDGSSIKEVKLEKFMSSYVFYGVKSYDNRYLLIKGNGGGASRYFEYDVITGKSTVFAKNARAVWPMYEGMLGVFGNDIKLIENNRFSEERIWKSKALDLDTCNVKTLKRIIADCGKDIEVTVTTEAGSYTVKGEGIFRVGLPGTKFTFSIRGRGSVRKITAEWEVRE